MIKEMIDKFEKLTLDSKTGKFLADKSYKYDTIHFMVKFILEHCNDSFFNSDKYRDNVSEYTVQTFNLDPKSDGKLNMMNETLNLLVYSNVLIEIRSGLYEIVSFDILKYIVSSMENAYIYLYLITYYTFLNDNLLDLYHEYVNSDDKNIKESTLMRIYNKIQQLSPSIIELNTIWSKNYTKFPIMVLGLLNDEKCISRELKLKNEKITPAKLSANVPGTKTKEEFKKNNDYINTFDISYVKDILCNFIVREVK